MSDCSSTLREENIGTSQLLSHEAQVDTHHCTLYKDTEFLSSLSSLWAEIEIASSLPENFLQNHSLTNLPRAQNTELIEQVPRQFTFIFFVIHIFCSPTFTNAFKETLQRDFSPAATSVMMIVKAYSCIPSPSQLGD